MSLTLNAPIIFSVICLAGFVELAVWCHLAPVASDAGELED
jgi:hypothetical protein